MRSYIKINSYIPAIIIAFTLGYLTTGILKLYIGKISQTELDEHEAKKVIDILSDFEKDG